ncbi:endonuclease III domain-containing protein [Sphingomonas sp. DT-204]|uniref:endonuclease III domain-containing protein n=1 Tax=Sphingomonas sp. DT-204 TaxID=3396166 RepID=UPI003F5404B5
MQGRFAFGAEMEIERWQAALAPLAATVVPGKPRTPIGQLVKSMISGRTRDEVSLEAYRRLGRRFGSVGRLAAAERREVLAAIRDVTFAEDKAAYLLETLHRIGHERGGYTLDFLGEALLDDALAWLERFPGVGRKVAASTLNASTLARPVFIVDSHVLRVLRRLGFVSGAAEARAASEAVTAAMPLWSGADFLRFHIACKRLGQTLCRPEAPHCAACPLAADCRRQAKAHPARVAAAPVLQRRQEPWPQATGP